MDVNEFFNVTSAESSNENSHAFYPSLVKRQESPQDFNYGAVEAAQRNHENNFGHQVSSFSDHTRKVDNTSEHIRVSSNPQTGLSRKTHPEAHDMERISPVHVKKSPVSDQTSPSSHHGKRKTEESDMTPRIPERIPSPKVAAVSSSQAASFGFQNAFYTPQTSSIGSGVGAIGSGFVQSGAAGGCSTCPETIVCTVGSDGYRYHSSPYFYHTPLQHHMVRFPILLPSNLIT